MTDEDVVTAAVHEHTPADWAHVACPWCDRLAVIQLYADAQVQVSHECPGPWLLDSIDPTDDDPPTWGLTIGAGGRPLLRYPGESLGPGIRITVELRDLWLALGGFGIDDPSRDECEAAGRLDDQVTEAESELGGRSDVGR